MYQRAVAMGKEFRAKGMGAVADSTVLPSYHTITGVHVQLGPFM